MDGINNKEVEPVAPVPDDDQTDHICPHCGADLFEVGVVEAISGQRQRFTLRMAKRRQASLL